ncbi:MAG: hypothetical protein GX790_07680, partial [Syntrophomonadaceae bacterium]|nr:hypothetical protein [Syntrophomonadaceae bacterium]
YGLCLGYAYQIIDDVLDFVADEELLGKTIGNDLIQGNITLPVIIALKDPELGPSLRKLLENNEITSDLIPQIIRKIETTGAFNESIRRARFFLQSGLDIIAELPQSLVRKKLQDLSVFILNNYYEKTNKNIILEDIECQVLPT